MPELVTKCVWRVRERTAFPSLTTSRRQRLNRECTGQHLPNAPICSAFYTFGICLKGYKLYELESHTKTLTFTAGC